MTRTIASREVREMLVFGQELAFIDLRDEADYALDHPLFASNYALPGAHELVPRRVPRRDVPLVLYHGDMALAGGFAEQLLKDGYRNVALLEGGLEGWRAAGYELFQDVNSYAKAFGELVAEEKHTPMFSAEHVRDLIDGDPRLVLCDARRPDEYRTASLPRSVSVPGAELLLLAPSMATDAASQIVVHCAGRTRSIIGAQSLINAGIANPVVALRDGTIGWRLAGNAVTPGVAPQPAPVTEEEQADAAARACALSYRAGVKTIDRDMLVHLETDTSRTLYCFDVRSEAAYVTGHASGFVSVPGGQLVQEIDMMAPVRGARLVLCDTSGVEAHMTASWLAQMAWECYVIEPDQLEWDRTEPPPAVTPEARPYKRPYVGTDATPQAMQAYLDWEFGLVEQLRRDGTHGFFVI